MRVVEINSYSDYSLNLSNVYKYAKTIGGVYACFAAEELKSTFVTRSTDAGTMNIQQLAESEFESYPGEFEEWWDEGKSYLIKFSQDDINLYFCFGVKIGNTAYFGNFSVGLSMLETDEDVDAFYDIAFLTLVGFPILDSKQVSSETLDKTSDSRTNNKDQGDSNTLSDIISIPDGYINGYAYIDLGLPSRTKWATYNIGANSPEENGNYYAWGDIGVKSKYDYSTCHTEDIGGSKAATEKMCEAGNLKSLYDAASVNWGSSWHMPTCTEIMELTEKCTWTWITYKGKNGYRGVGPNGKSIFLPAAGYKFDTSLEGDNEIGNYWSSTIGMESYSCNLYFLNTTYKPHSYQWGLRPAGYPVRPVHP